MVKTITISDKAYENLDSFEVPKSNDDRRVKGKAAFVCDDLRLRVRLNARPKNIEIGKFLSRRRFFPEWEVSLTTPSRV